MILVTPTKTEPDWGRPRRQTDPNVVRRPSELLRQAARRSVDYAAEQRPRTSASKDSPTFHRSPLSAHALSNPALAEIPSRKFNALRLSTGASDDQPPSGGVKHNVNRDNVSGNVQSPCTPDLTARSDIISTHTTTHPTSSLLTPVSPKSEPRLPLRRAPASHSSLGIETSTGPPPAISTQLPAFQDRLLRPYSTQSTPISEDYPSPSIDAILKSDLSGDRASEKRRRLANGRMPSVNTTHDPDRTMTLEDHNGDEAKDSSTDDSRSKSDDVFLNIAKSTASRRDSAGKLDRRRRLGLSGLSSRSSLAKEQTPSPEQLKYQSSPLLSQDGSPLVSYASSAHPLDDNSRLRYFGVGSSARSTVGIPRSRFSRETSPESPQTYAELRSSVNDRSYRHSNLSSRTIRQAVTPDADRARIEADKARLDGTESTLSTTAPSTVWDELDDLKSRIRKLELTGKFPPSSAAAMSNASAERPRTAATTVTTLSSSPKHNRKTSTSPDPESSATASQIQNLLHSALAKAKTAVNPEVYNALEVTATDALTLTNMLGSRSQPSTGVSVVNGSGLSDRQARRKGDSLCRSLTELCLALFDDQVTKQSQDQQRPVSRDTPSRANQLSGMDRSDALSTAATYRRSMSHEPEIASQQESASRVPSRLETRRASTINLGSTRPAKRLSQDEQSSPQTGALSPPVSRLNRISSLRAKRDDDSDDKGSVFSRTAASSRAMSEVAGFSGGLRSSTRERLSREYVSESPPTRAAAAQPATQSTRAPSLAPSSLPLRRSLASPTGSGIPALSSIPIQPGFRRYGGSSGLAQSGSPGQTTESAPSLSQTRIVAPSSKTAASYTSIQPARVRTNSISSRRLGLRPRPSTMSPIDREQ